MLECTEVNHTFLLHNPNSNMQGYRTAPQPMFLQHHTIKQQQNVNKMFTHCT